LRSLKLIFFFLKRKEAMRWWDGVRGASHAIGERREGGGGGRAREERRNEEAEEGKRIERRREGGKGGGEEEWRERRERWVGRWALQELRRTRAQRAALPREERTRGGWKSRRRRGRRATGEERHKC